MCSGSGGSFTFPLSGSRPRLPLPAATLRSARPPHPQGEGRAAAAGKCKVSAAQSDAKILKELFGGGYLEIRPCEGPRVQITAAPAPEQAAAPGCLDGARVARSEAPDQPPRTPGRWVRFPPGFSGPLLSRTSSRERRGGFGQGGCARSRTSGLGRSIRPERSFLPGGLGSAQLLWRVLSLEVKVALLSTRGFCLLFADRHRVQGAVCWHLRGESPTGHNA